MKVQYIYTMEIPDEKAAELEQAATNLLCAPLDARDRAIIVTVMGQVIDQLKRIADTQVGASQSCAAMIQHCCVLGMVATTQDAAIRFRLMPDDPTPAPKRDIIWN